MARLLLLTNALAPSAEVLPALGLLSHTVRILPAEATALVDSPDCDVVIVDARRELASARSLCRVLRTTGIGTPLLAVLTEGGLAGLTAEWGLDDVLLDSAGPAEVDARLRLAMTKGQDDEADLDMPITSGELVIDEASYSAKFRGSPLDLTYKEFELIKYLAQHPGRVFTRAQLLQEVWGYDYYGGTRTVDVHVRRLRAKLGPDHEALIGTVRNVGYRLVPDRTPTPRRPGDRARRRLTRADARAGAQRKREVRRLSATQRPSLLSGPEAQRSRRERDAVERAAACTATWPSGSSRRRRCRAHRSTCRSRPGRPGTRLHHQRGSCWSRPGRSRPG